MRAVKLFTRAVCTVFVLQACTGNTNGGASCGDGVCGEGESCETCPEDCGECCGECDTHASCREAGDGWACVCDEGYEGDGVSCTDVDECEEGTHSCAPNAACVNTEGGYGCECREGYEGDGLTCTDVDECEEGTHSCAPNAACVNTEGGYGCECREGYEGNGLTCTDVDECEEGTHSCAPNAACVNTEGGYGCDCSAAEKANCYHVIRALCVITDFANRALEDYVSAEPDAFTSEESIRRRLEEMSEHWEWMSRATRLMQWDIERIELDQDLEEDAFPGWSEFRQAAAEAVRGLVEPEQYDVDGDGVLDVVWFVTSSGEIEYDYLIGGMARVAGVNTFVDGQGSFSVRSAATGNFNHEIGHCLGLPDIYGDHDTLVYLSLMSYSWPVPPHGFSAYDRLLLGWLDPVVVEETTAGIVLGPAEESLEAVLVPTDRQSEFFLVEYRSKPAEGFGSAPGPGYDGLAVYHVLDSRLKAGANNVDPPLIRLEPPDGSVESGTGPLAGDFWYPGNPEMGGPYVGTSYFTLDEVVQIDGLAWVDGGLRFDVTRLSTTTDLPNLLANGDFESGTGDDLDSWHSTYWHDGATFTWEHGTGREGSNCTRIDLESPGDTFWYQEITGLTAGRTYELHGWIKGENIEGDYADVGASLSLMDSSDRSAGCGLGTFDWTEIYVAFTADDATAVIQCRLGHTWNTVTGTAWFDDLTLVQMTY